MMQCQCVVTQTGTASFDLNKQDKRLELKQETAVLNRMYRGRSINLINDQTVWFAGVCQYGLHLGCRLEDVVKHLWTPVITASGNNQEHFLC